MSYARFGEADVYVFHSSSGYLECCGCIRGDKWDFNPPREMLVHLEEHVAAGDHVPGYVFEYIRADFPDLDKRIEIDPMFVKGTTEYEARQKQLGLRRNVVRRRRDQ